MRVYSSQPYIAVDATLTALMNWMYPGMGSSPSLPRGQPLAWVCCPYGSRSTLSSPLFRDHVISCELTLETNQPIDKGLAHEVTQLD